MIPKKKRRLLTVGKMKYEYCIQGFVSVFIHNLVTDEKYSWGEDWKPKWKQSIKPSDIRTMLETGEWLGIKLQKVA